MKFHNNYIWHAMLFSILFAGNAWTMSMEKESKSKIVRDEMKFYSDYIIDSTDIVNDRIRIMGGDLFIYGQIDNKITVIGGDVTIGATAIINGEIIAVGGTVLTQDGAIINGKIIEANLNEGLVYRETFTDSAETRKNAFFELKRKSDWLREGWIHPKDDFLIYNRNYSVKEHYKLNNLIKYLLKKNYNVHCVGDHLKLQNLKNHNIISRERVKKLLKSTKLVISSPENPYSLFTLDAIKMGSKILFDIKYRGKLSFLKYNFKQYINLDKPNYKYIEKTIKQKKNNNQLDLRELISLKKRNSEYFRNIIV